jgi:hypothetical protein
MTLPRRRAEGGGPEVSARIVTRESLASLLPLILHFADLAFPAKTPTLHGVRRVRRTDTTFRTPISHFQIEARFHERRSTKSPRDIPGSRGEAHSRSLE